MNPERFRNSSAGRVIRVGQGETAYWAFVPYPLPPRLVMNPRLVCQLSEADRALGELAGLGRTMPNPHLLIRPFLRREAVLSSRIEGTRAEITDLYSYEARQLALPGFQPRESEADVREVYNYVRALEYGLERLKTLPVSLRLIRELHERLMEGVRGEQATPGEFRRSQNWIGPPTCTLNEAIFVPPPVEEMHQALEAFEKYLHSADEHPPLIRLAFIHYQFEAIHPFLGGNGRIGRLLISLLLVNWGLLPSPLLYLSAFFERHRDSYYDLLLKVSEPWQEWVRFFLEGVASQSRDAIVRAKRLQDLQAEWRQRIQRERIGVLTIRLMEELFFSPVFSPPEVAKRLRVSHQAVMQSIRKLEQGGILQEITGRQRHRLYAALDILSLLDERELT
ncbi:MAG: Fic family protein [Candidatus Bipolaricaulota bacterium]|nr:Fic family protein [Candidatus Bipolaricaulota bacterium]MDW8329602.1 Fic family protein [Candidatus Bipolaricaulota bacterium]